MYNYKATLNRVVDGDTVNLTIDLGFRLSYTANCRLAGINAPELNTDEGKASRDALRLLIGQGQEVNIFSTGLDKYGRPIVVIRHHGIDVNIEMIKKGYAVKY
jgi:micrococcal nuclease